MWSLISFLGIVHLANAAFLRCYGDSLEEFDAASLDQARTLLNSSYYNNSCPNLIYAFGYRGKVNGPTTNTSLTSMINFKNKNMCVNVFMMDWMEEASSTDAFGENGIKAVYVSKALLQTKTVGWKFGEALVDMAKYGFNLTRTHLLGFSLGAHLFGNTGRYVRDNGNGKMVDRITGLDPAGPLFESSFSIFSSLDKTCATFVDALHTDPGGYGINASSANVDIWPNFNKFINGAEKDQVQPGCPVGRYAFMSPEDICSHDRSVKLMAEMFNLNHTLQASKAPNYQAWAAGDATTIIYLGEDIDRSASGDFFLMTNAESPFGKGSNGLQP